MTQSEVNVDYFRLDDGLTDGERALRDRVRAYVASDILPIINDFWERAEFPAELLPGLARLGIIGSTINGYGCPGLSRRAAGIVAREIARGDGSINTFLGVHSSLCMGAINMLGSPEQKQRWLPSLATLEKIGAFALTEPEHGSDSVALETSARRDGEDFVLNGHKRWIGNGDRADVVVIFARDVADSQVKAFVLEKGDDVREKSGDGAYPAGYRPTVITGKSGKRAIMQADIVLENLWIPARNVLEFCHSFKDVSSVLTATRGGAAWEAVGHGMAAYEIAVAYALERRQFGKPIGSFQLVQSRLANMLSELTSMQLMCTRMAELAEADQLTGPMASMVKMSTAQKGKWICAEARDILAGNGLLLERHVARHLTDMDVVSTYEGTDSIQSLLVGRDITGISAFK
ncbi:acyl-CoA dehydrogenase family protein [Arthrobacter sp. H14-L1]|uniref:acyl-CoA dehydrogenase family protein n=1 Tax=Arthrobacter sp. H14-L1 TaxID=2996697 RepID=UPI00226EFC6B|nr:acyl-CoA dehydrogenase family protein [Arthrobacter sp. H14-L1]MCY0903852.1 acyl-CoA dehydrogenase family protein [Arthrobacter sp. H14-L1]